jgi:fumarylacetoacetate (FAA) hydrolase family protein
VALDDILPEDAAAATLVGRVWDPDVHGPCVVVVDGPEVVDVSRMYPTTSVLFESYQPAELARAVEEGDRVWSLSELLAPDRRGRQGPRLLSPVDLQVVKAAGVTFVESMLERVIEERAAGDPAQAAAVRERVARVIGGAISAVVPGSPEAGQVTAILKDAGLWSQYLEVGIGPDPEIFTKCPVLASVGVGEPIGVLSRSQWNNPEPEVVLVVRSDGVPVGAALGNDVNLRDFEGRSALLLTEAKDNNASCAIGPFIRVFDGAFGIDDVRRLDITLTVTGADGFVLNGTSSMKNISRDPLELVGHAYGDHHQYPDGFVLFTGTLFAPTQDRDAPGAGFTHRLGDVVRIASPRLGALVNRVEPSERAPRWDFGIWDLAKNLHDRGLL